MQGGMLGPLPRKFIGITGARWLALRLDQKRINLTGSAVH
jgi:hypothetical protein